MDMFNDDDRDRMKKRVIQNKIKGEQKEREQSTTAHQACFFVLQ